MVPAKDVQLVHTVQKKKLCNLDVCIGIWQSLKVQIFSPNPNPWKLTQSPIQILDPSNANNAVPTQRYVHDDSMPSFGF